MYFVVLVVIFEKGTGSLIPLQYSLLNPISQLVIPDPGAVIPDPIYLVKTLI